MTNSPITEIVLGEKFPMKEHLYPGDFNRAFLTASNFDVIISLTDITEREEFAIADEEFDVYIVDTNYGPLMVFKFGDELQLDFSLNILKMNPADVHDWLQNPDEIIHIYVLEGRNSVVKAIRFVQFKEMYNLKVSCMRQLDKDKTTIDAFIQNVYSQYSIPDLIRRAQYHFVVPETELSL